MAAERTELQRIKDIHSLGEEVAKAWRNRAGLSWAEKFYWGKAFSLQIPGDPPIQLRFAVYTNDAKDAQKLASSDVESVAEAFLRALIREDVLSKISGAFVEELHDALRRRVKALAEELNQQYVDACVVQRKIEEECLQIEKGTD